MLPKSRLALCNPALVVALALARENMGDISSSTIALWQESDSATMNTMPTGVPPAKAKPRDGVTALMEAAESGYSGIVQTLLGNGADVNARDNIGWTALIFAAGEGHTNIVQTLINKGAEIDVITIVGITALTVAECEGHRDVVVLLKQHGAKE